MLLLLWCWLWDSDAALDMSLSPPAQPPAQNWDKGAGGRTTISPCCRSRGRSAPLPPCPVASPEGVLLWLLPPPPPRTDQSGVGSIGSHAQGGQYQHQYNHPGTNPITTTTTKTVDAQRSLLGCVRQQGNGNDDNNNNNSADDNNDINRQQRRQ